MLRLSRLACILLFACTLPLAHAEEQADSSVARKLDAFDTPYVVDDDGDYRILVRLEDDRTQLVWVRSQVHTSGSQNIREIWTYGLRSEDRRLPPHIANRLLQENFELVQGTWARHDGNAVLVIRIDADAEARVLDESIDLAASLGDQMEQRLVSGDEL